MPLVPCKFASKSELMLDLTVYGTLIQDCLSVDEIRECVKAEYLESLQQDLHNKPTSLSKLVTPEFIIQYQQELQLAEDEEEIVFSDNEEGYDEYLIQEGVENTLEEFIGDVSEVESTFGTITEAPYVPMEVSEDGWSTAEEQNEDANYEGYSAEELTTSSEIVEPVFEDDFSDLTPIDSVPTGLSMQVSQDADELNEFDTAVEQPEDLSYEDYTVEEFSELDSDEFSSLEIVDTDSENSSDFDEDEVIYSSDEEDDWEDDEIKYEEEEYSSEDEEDDWDEEASEALDLDEISEVPEDDDDWNDSDVDSDDEDDWGSSDGDSEDDWDESEEVDDWEDTEEVSKLGIDEEPEVHIESAVVSVSEHKSVSTPDIIPEPVVQKPVKKKRQGITSCINSIPVNVPPPVVQHESDTVKPAEIDRSAEPTDIRAFVRAHPHCSHAELSKYFTKKAIQKALMLGKIIKKGNTYQI